VFEMFGREEVRETEISSLQTLQLMVLWTGRQEGEGGGAKMDWATIVKPNANIFGGRSPNKCRTRLFLIWVLRVWQERIGPDGDKIHCAARHVMPNKLDSVKVNMKIQGNLWTLDAIS
jgi:hypothetical protein